MTAYRLLRARAESYWRDGQRLILEEEPEWGHAFRAIATELRKVADEIGDDA